MAMQNVTEEKKIVLFETSWNQKCNGVNAPYSFLIINSPETIYPLAFQGMKKRFPHIKTAIGIAPNDEAAWGSAKLAKELWKDLGVESSTEFYERGTADFYPVVTKVLDKKPDLIDTGGTATGAALILKVLHEMKWEGIKFNGPMPGWKMVVKAAGNEAVEGLMGGLAPNFKGGIATPLQKELAAKCEKDINVELSSLGICAWDAIQALLAAIKQAQSIEHAAIRETLPKIIFQSSYGPMAIGNSKIWNRPAQFLIPTCVSEIKNGKLHEMMRIISPELKERLQAGGIDWKKHYQ
jgi:branched-chain amino acid transport system substrate-binding protein